MKFLVLFPYPVEPDGQSIQGDMLCKGLTHYGHEVIPCHFRPSIQKTYYLENLNPDVVLGIGFWGNVPDIVKEPQEHGLKTVPWFNADGWVANYQDEFNKLDLMFTTSEWVKSIYKRDGVDVSKIIPAHIGIDTNLFKPNLTEEQRLGLRRMIGVKDNEKMILTIGGDVTSKGAQEIIRALAEVDKEFKDWKYVCKSWPSKCAEMWREKEIELLNEFGLQEKVIFIDDAFSQEFMADILNACDIYAAPSRIEGFGMIQVEAMACGKPVVSINVGGPAETIIHGKTGFLAKVAEEVILRGEWAYPHMGFRKKEFINFAEPKIFAYRADITELKEYLLKLLTDEELCKTMGKAAREHAVEKFDYKVTSKFMLDKIKEKFGFE